jgi:phospholipid/cholesterol/gamma-HCH transport system substrate-binding protein
MDPRQASRSTQYKVGIFTLLALLLVGAATVFVNDKPFWWRPCQLVYINVDDATGLKTKSPVRSLGLQIGYLSTVQLTDSKVRLGICVTAQVEVTQSTRAYIRGEGFLGDKFVELKPVKYVGPSAESPQEPYEGEPQGIRVYPEDGKVSFFRKVLNWIIPSANAEEAAEPTTPTSTGRTTDSKGRKTREVPVGQGSQDVQQVVNQVNSLVNEVTSLTQSLKQAIKPEELRTTMQQLNRTLENASRTLSPEGNLTTTAQRTLTKLEDAIEQLRDTAIKINRGEGSAGMFLHDPYYAESVKELLKNANQLLNKASGMRFVVDLSGVSLPAGDGSRGAFMAAIWPRRDRYYRLGVSVDSARGRQIVMTTTTESGGVSTTVRSTTREETALMISAMIGRVYFNRIDLSAGVLHNDGAVSLFGFLGPHGREENFKLGVDLYSRALGQGFDSRFSGVAKIFDALYLTAGMESVNQLNGKVNYFCGAGVSFDDEDIKILFALR